MRAREPPESVERCGVRLLRGSARFVAPEELVVVCEQSFEGAVAETTRRVRAGKFIVCCGADPAMTTAATGIAGRRRDRRRAPSFARR